MISAMRQAHLPTLMLLPWAAKAGSITGLLTREDASPLWEESTWTDNAVSRNPSSVRSTLKRHVDYLVEDVWFSFDPYQSVDLLDPTATCPAGWISWQNTCFFVGAESVKWTDAKEKCGEVDGSSLASCFTTEESNYITAHLGSGTYHIGINDM